MEQNTSLIEKIQEWGLNPKGYDIPVTNNFLYFICDEGANYLKIGISINPKERLKNIQTGNPLKLILLLTFYATPGIETRLHSFLKEYCLEGEWYPLVGEPGKIVFATIKDLCLGYFCGMTMPIFNYVYRLNND